MSLNEQFAFTILVAVGLMNAGCSEGTVGIGSDDPAEAKTGLAAYAGNWDGYVEALTFEDGNSDRVRLFLDEQGQGTLRFGDRELLDKPTDPNVLYYPPQTETISTDFGPAMVFEGFEYPLRESTVEAPRFRGTSNSLEIKRDFCAIHPAYPYRQSLDQDPSAPWVVSYSITPVTFVGVEHSDGTCAIVLYETAPTTLEQLSSNPTVRLPCVDVGNGSANDIAAYNLAHPERPMTMPTQWLWACEGDENGRYRLSTEAANTLDIQIDVALDKTGDSLNGSLTLPPGPRESGRIVRTVRLTRVR